MVLVPSADWIWSNPRNASWVSFNARHLTFFAVYILSVHLLTALAALSIITDPSIAVGTKIIAGASQLLLTIINAGPPGHFLIHQKSMAARSASVLLLTSVAFHTFCIEHFKHHGHAGSSDDVFYAPPGTSIYQTVNRAFRYYFVGVWQDVDQKERRFLIQNWIYYVMMLVLTALMFGLGGAIFWLGIGGLFNAAIFGISYIEHYGIERNTAQPARSYHGAYSNALFCNQQLHEEHHQQPGKNFAELSKAEKTRLYPASFVWMLLLSLLPKQWFKVNQPWV